VKNIIVAFLTLIIIGAMIYTASQGGAYHGGEAGNVIDDIQEQTAVATQRVPPVTDDREIEQEKLKALRDKAGNVGKFNVSHNYKSKCASCHGMNGEGIIGPKLFGLEADAVYAKLLEYKSGRKENLVMKGLLLNLDKTALREYADEIGTFKERAAALQEQVE